MRCSPMVRARRARVCIGVVISGAMLVGASAWTAPAFGQADPAEEADRAVAEAQRRADRAADEYFDALERGYKLDREVGSMEEEVEALGHEVVRLRKVAVERAVDAYKRAGSSFTDTFGDQALPREAIRRTVLLGVVNAHDREAAAALDQAREDRERARDELRAARAEQADTIEQLRAEEARLNDLLVEAQSQRRALAEQQAAAAAAAAAATTTTVAPANPSPGPTSSSPGTPSTSAPPNPTQASPAPAPPAPNYTPRSGVHPRHDDPFLVCTRQHESSGNYQAYNPAGPFYGAYQFLQSTWNATANHAGRGDLVGLDPRRASAYDQDDMAWTLYQWRGKGPWNGRC